MLTSSGLDNVVVILVLYHMRSKFLKILLEISTLSPVFVLILAMFTLEVDRSDNSPILDDT